MTHLSREKREELPTYRVMSDDLETYYGRIRKGQNGVWYRLREDSEVLPGFLTRAGAVSACVSAGNGQ